MGMHHKCHIVLARKLARARERELERETWFHWSPGSPMSTLIISGEAPCTFTCVTSVGILALYF